MNSTLRNGAFEASAAVASVCPPFDGNADLYGLGIRLGIYLQLISSLLGSYYHPEILGDAWDTNAIFLIAVFLAILRSIAVSELKAVEGFVMLQLLMAFLLSVFDMEASLLWLAIDFLDSLKWIYLPQDMRNIVDAHLATSRLGVVARGALVQAIGAFQVYFWFWFVPHSDTCRSYIFLFAKVPLSAPAWTFFQFLATLYLLALFPGFFVFVLECAFWSIGKLKKGPSKTAKTQSRGSFIYNLVCAMRDEYISLSSPKPLVTKEIGEMLRPFANWSRHKRDAGDLRRVRVYSSLMDLVIILWSVLTVELTLHFNSVGDVYVLGTTGQFIPFIIGLAGLLRTLHMIVLQRVVLHKRKAQGEFKPVSKKDAAQWKYVLRDGRIAIFPAVEIEPRSRRSLDDRYMAQAPVEPGSYALDDMPPAPNLEPRTSDEVSEYNPYFIEEDLEDNKSNSSFIYYGGRRASWDTEHWDLPSGKTQTFAGGIVKRRWSLESAPLKAFYIPRVDEKEEKTVSKTQETEDIKKQQSKGGGYREFRGEYKVPWVKKDSGRFVKELKNGREVVFHGLPVAHVQSGWRRGSYENYAYHVPIPYIEDEKGSKAAGGFWARMRARWRERWGEWSWRWKRNKWAAGGWVARPLFEAYWKKPLVVRILVFVILTIPFSLAAVFIMPWSMWKFPDDDEETGESNVESLEA